MYKGQIFNMYVKESKKKLNVNKEYRFQTNFLMRFYLLCF
jgi:hypothetical protein